MAFWIQKNRREGLGLLLLVAVYLLTGLSYIWVTPCFEKPDEQDHYGYVRYLRENRRLPPLAPHKAWLFESKQPPLYYVLVALVTEPFSDVADPETLIIQNPYLDLSVPGYREDNRNVYLHPPTMTPVVFVGRSISLLFGMGTVLSVYILAKLFLPRNSLFALATAASVGFQPMFLFIATSLSNDAATTFFATLVLTLLVYRHRHTEARHFSLFMGFALGLAALTKVSALVLFPLVAVGLVLIRKRIDRRFFIELVQIGCVAFIVGGWWYGRNAWFYSDPFTLNAHLYRTIRSRPLATYFWQDLRDIERTFWGNLSRVFVSFIWLDRVALWWGRINIIVLMMAVIRYYWRILKEWEILTLLALWLLTFGVLLVGFWARQANWAWGRFLLPAIGPVMVLFMFGWYICLHGRWQKLGLWGVASSMLWIGILSPWLTIYPLYHPHRPLKSLEYPVNLVLHDTTGTPIAALLGYNLPQPYTTSGSYVPIEICWETFAVTDKPLTKFVQLIELAATQEGRLPGNVGVRNTYPGLGNLPTDRWPLGKQFCDWILVKVSDTASAPMGTALEIGLLDAETGERLQFFTHDGQPVGWTVFKGIAIVEEMENVTYQAKTSTLFLRKTKGFLFINAKRGHF